MPSNYTGGKGQPGSLQRRPRRPSHPAASFAPAPHQTPPSQMPSGGIVGAPNPQYAATLAMHNDPGVVAAVNAGQQIIGRGDAEALYQGNAINADYGIDAQGLVDPNNPYSRAALLQESYRRSVRGNTNSYASAGQLYSGALQNAQDESGRNYNIGFDQLKKGYAGAQHKVIYDQTGAHDAATTGISTATAAWLTAWLKGQGLA